MVAVAQRFYTKQKTVLESIDLAQDVLNHISDLNLNLCIEHSRFQKFKYKEYDDKRFSGKEATNKSGHSKYHNA